MELLKPLCVCFAQTKTGHSQNPQMSSREFQLFLSGLEIKPMRRFVCWSHQASMAQPADLRLSPISCSAPIEVAVEIYTQTKSNGLVIPDAHDMRRGVSTSTSPRKEGILCCRSL